MKKITKISFLLIFMVLFFCGTASAKSKTTGNALGEGAFFGDYDTIYYKLTLDCPFSLSIHAVYGFAGESELRTFLNTRSNSESDDGKKTWNRRYSFTLCDKNKKEIDPIGWHKPGKKNYRYQYFLKKGTYLIKIKTGRKKCGIFFINGLYYPQSGSKSKANNSPGGATKSKATKLKTPDKSSIDTQRALANDYYWNGNYFSFPYMDSGKKAAAWFKCYSDGSKPLYVIARVDSMVGKWDLVAYGPSFPKKGQKITFPGEIVLNKKGIVQLYKNGRKANRINVFTLARRDDSTGKLVGPARGWYYFKVMKHQKSGKKASYYKKMSILGDMYVTTNSKFKNLKY